ncbi:hypothetical protein L198_08251 [Cryptococcus wingfieldii CBS 7118]|uniref:Uncharacterized protein n=1 Tax=Cryptococcus wingfieldii CBS 7118 TaxID=1295528 RepID=A0A1E3HDP3_9TREE|nr:hypothetical protein L198_08251 [Cryptococcus wingfieldii CBS 7118]
MYEKAHQEESPMHA